MSPLESYFDLSGQRVLVTGAASGIGESIAHTFAGRGATVIAADRNEAGLQDLASRLRKSCEFHVYDQAVLTSVEALCAKAGEVDILVNNAGMVIRQPILDLDLTDLQRIVGVNLLGPIATTRLIGETMVRRRRGIIINISSQMAFTGARDRAVYAATKSAITQFTKTTALEWGPYGIRANGIAPGRTVTALNREILADPAAYEAGLKRIPLGRYGQPEDIAWAALFLASKAGGYITGQTIIVDGGWVLE